MKKIALLFCAALIVFAAGAAWAEGEYVRLAIKGTNVNLRPQPLAAGRVIAKMNTGDIFIAEKVPLLNDYDNSKWFKIVLAVDAATGKISLLSEWDSRFKANAAFVHADYAAASPLAKGDMEKISATPEGVQHLTVLPDSLLTESGSIAGYWANVSYSEGGGAYLGGYCFAEDGTGWDFAPNAFEITSYTYVDGNLSYTFNISEDLAETEGYEPGNHTSNFEARLLYGNYLAKISEYGISVYNRVLNIESTGWCSYNVTLLDGSVLELREGRLVGAR